MAGEVFGVSVMILLVLFLFYWMPVIWVLMSDRTEGVMKFAWFIVTLFFSWVGLIAFLLLAPPKGGYRQPGPM